MGVRGPTQRELQIAEKEDFLQTNNFRFTSLLIDWFIMQGFFVIGDDIQRFEDERIPNMSAVKKLRDTFFSAQRMVADGGPLTAKRRENILESFYALEKEVEAIPNPHTLYIKMGEYVEAVNKAKKLSRVGVGFCMTIFLIPIGIIVLFFFYRNKAIANLLGENALESAVDVVSPMANPW